MKIVSLSSENIKRISAVEIRPDGDVVVIGGKNGAGKSSVLDSIAYALGGKDAMPSQPIRKGQDHAEIVVELDGLVVTRKFTEKGSYLTVTDTDGKTKYNSPQRMLDDLVGRLSFDPLAFSRMSAKDQSQQIRELVGLNTDELDAKRSELYDQRRDINRDLKSAEANLASAPHHDDAPDSEVDAKSIMQSIAQASGRAAERDRLVSIARTTGADVVRIKEEIKALQDRLEVANKAHVDAVADADAAVDACLGDDIKALTAQAETADATNRKVRDNENHARLKGLANNLRKQSEEITRNIGHIDTEKATMLAGAEYPVDGLGFTDDGLVTFGGIPFDQASAAEQLRVSVAMGLAMNPKLRVLLIRDGSLLDDESLAMVAKMAAEQDAQVWIERVGEGDEVSVVIEDGAVREAVAV